MSERHPIEDSSHFRELEKDLTAKEGSPPVEGVEDAYYRSVMRRLLTEEGSRIREEKGRGPTAKELIDKSLPLYRRFENDLDTMLRSLNAEDKRIFDDNMTLEQALKKVRETVKFFEEAKREIGSEDQDK